MTIDDLCTLRNDIQNLLDAHSEDFSGMSDGDIDSSEELKKAYNERMDPGRLLHIGIVGRVKAGKSSLLNSLFFGGSDILPKAATPMTAALTKLKYSEKPSIKVNFFDSDDINKFREKAREYDIQFNSLVEEGIRKKKEIAERNKKNFDEREARNRCEILVKNDLRNSNPILAGAREQIDLINKSGSQVTQFIGKSNEKDVASFEKLKEELRSYVGTDGEYTAITRDVELGLPFEELKNITVVDTPGFDDPVPSRDAAARQSLKKCDVIFILSPAGQFCNQEDKSNIEKIEKGEGIQEIFVIASKIDAELGNEAKEEALGDISEELRIIVKTISTTLDKLIKGLHSGIVKDKLGKDLEQGLLYTSGVCQAMIERWNESSSWSSELCDTWERLQETYPDLFGVQDDSAKEILKIIGNVDGVKTKIAEVREKKDKILTERRENFVNLERESLVNWIKAIHKNFTVKKDNFERTDVDNLQKEQKQLKEKFDVLKTTFEEMLSETFEDYLADCREISTDIINKFYKGTLDEANNAQCEQTQTQKGTREVAYDVEVKDDGVWGRVQRFFGWGGYHTETRYRNEEYTYDEVCNRVNASDVREALSVFANELKDELNLRIDKQKKLLRGKLKHNILEIWSQYEVNEICDERLRNVQASDIVKVVPNCDLGIQWSLPVNLQSRGQLSGDEADEFMEEARDEFRRVKSIYTQSIKEFLSDVQKKIIGVEIADSIMEKMQESLNQTSRDMENKAATLDRFKRIEKELRDFIQQVES